jgi:hypothetical protein
VICDFFIASVGIGFYGSYEIIFSATTVWGSRLAWSRLVDLGSIDSGSNPGSPTINSFKTNIFDFFRKKQGCFLFRSDTDLYSSIEGYTDTHGISFDKYQLTPPENF